MIAIFNDRQNLEIINTYKFKTVHIVNNQENYKDAGTEFEII